MIFSNFASTQSSFAGACFGVSCMLFAIFIHIAIHIPAHIISPADHPDSAALFIMLSFSTSE
jgi:hypothetical protein